MRLTCPNCGAQYEVPDDVIPAAGRDVQCSNCGNTWFEGPDGAMPIPTLKSAPVSEDPSPTRRPTRPTAPQQPAVSQPADSRGANADDTDEDDDDDLHPAPSRPAGAPRRDLDPAIADILKQEAEHERTARGRRDAEPLQSQPDLGLEGADPSAQRAEEARRRMARLKGETAPRPSDVVTGARSDRLPDIEEINSTLRSNRERRAPETEPEEFDNRRARGFRFGFALSLIVLAAGMMTFTYASQIAEQVPQLAPYLDRYVSEVEVLRIWVDQQIQSVTQRFGAGQS